MVGGPVDDRPEDDDERVRRPLPAPECQDAGFLYVEHAGLPQLVAIVAVAEGGPLHDPDGRLRLDAVRGSSAAAWSWSPGCVSWCCARARAVP
jgi:hypothetical protein